MKNENSFNNGAIAFTFDNETVCVRTFFIHQTNKTPFMSQMDGT